MRSQAGLPFRPVDAGGLSSDQTPEAAREAWRAAATEAELAYRDWRNAGRRERRLAFAVYRAAADRETTAGEVLARCA
jgi:hypothetical protein